MSERVSLLNQQAEFPRFRFCPLPHRKPPEISRYLRNPRRTLLEGMPRHSVTAGFRDVYLLESPCPEGGCYAGVTDDLVLGLAAHNEGKVLSTRKRPPGRIRVAVAFGDPVRATAFENELKSGAGRAFAIRHL